MKRGKKLGVLLAVLLVILGATVLVTTLNPQGDTEGDTYTTVFTLDPDKVTKLGWDYSDEANFTRTEDGWVYDADPAFPVDEDRLNEMLQILSNVEATKIITEVENLDQYGLLYPFCAITVTVDGTRYDLAIGNPNSYSGGRYFSNGDGNVYMVDNAIVNYFAFGPEGVLAMEQIPDLSGITALTLQSDTQSYEIRYEENSDKTYSSHYTWFMDGKVLDTELTKSLLAVLQELEWQECADYNATDMAQYGLDAPIAVVTATSRENTFVLELGSEITKGVYARIAGSNMVYLVDDEIPDKLLYTTYSELMPDEVLAMDWDTVTSMDIIRNGKSYTLTCQEGADESGCATGELVWKLGDREVEGAGITDALDEMDTNGYATGLRPELAEELRFIFHRNTANYPEIELVLYRYDSSSCLTTLDGVSTVLADRSDVTALLNAVDQIITQ